MDSTEALRLVDESTLLDIMVDLGGKIDDTNEWVNRELIKLLQAKVEHHRVQLATFEAALRAARQDANPESAVVPLGPDKVYFPEQSTKTAYVRHLIETSEATGITAAEIRKHAKKDGVTVNANFPYAVLKRMLARKEIKEEQGRYSMSKQGARRNDITEPGTTKATTGER